MKEYVEYITKVILFNGSYFQNTPFYLACASGKLEIVQLLLQDSRINPNCTVSKSISKQSIKHD